MATITVTEKQHLKAKKKSVPHGSHTNYKGKLGSKNVRNVKVKGRKKILTDGGFMYV
jgi:hypothetical protein